MTKLKINIHKKEDLFSDIEDTVSFNLFYTINKVDADDLTNEEIYKILTFFIGAGLYIFYDDTSFDLIKTIREDNRILQTVKESLYLLTEALDTKGVEKTTKKIDDLEINFSFCSNTSKIYCEYFTLLNVPENEKKSLPNSNINKWLVYSEPLEFMAEEKAIPKSIINEIKQYKKTVAFNRTKAKLFNRILHPFAKFEY